MPLRKIIIFYDAVHSLVDSLIDPEKPIPFPEANNLSLCKKVMFLSFGGQVKI